MSAFFGGYHLPTLVPFLFSKVHSTAFDIFSSLTACLIERWQKIWTSSKERCQVEVESQSWSSRQMIWEWFSWYQFTTVVYCSESLSLHLRFYLPFYTFQLISNHLLCCGNDGSCLDVVAWTWLGYSWLLPRMALQPLMTPHCPMKPTASADV